MSVGGTVLILGEVLHHDSNKSVLIHLTHDSLISN